MDATDLNRENRRIDRQPVVGVIGVVDDDEPVRAALSSLMRAAGYKCAVFPSAEEFPVMQRSVDGQLLRIFIDLSDRWEGVPLYQAIVLEAQRQELAGATVIRPLKDQFYGERSGTVLDPFGHEWLLGGHLEDVSTEEMQRRYTQLFKK